MNVEEASTKYNLTEQEITTYERKGFIKAEGDGYTDETFKNLGVLRTLLSAGMDDEEICRYLKASDEGAQREQTAVLRGFRAKLLERVHTAQQALDHIDYLIFEINNKK